MSTHLPGFQSFYNVFHHFVLAKLAISSIRIKSRAVKTAGAEGVNKVDIRNRAPCHRISHTNTNPASP